MLTDASAVGIEAILEQDGHVVAYASRSLKSAKRNYSVIERECLAVVFAISPLPTGMPFHGVHRPRATAVALGAGLSCRWALAIQECDFTISYRKGNENKKCGWPFTAPLCRNYCFTPRLQMVKIRLAQQADTTESGTESKLPMFAETIVNIYNPFFVLGCQ